MLTDYYTPKQPRLFVRVSHANRQRIVDEAKRRNTTIASLVLTALQREIPDLEVNDRRANYAHDTYYESLKWRQKHDN